MGIFPVGNPIAYSFGPTITDKEEEGVFIVGLACYSFKI